MADDVISIKRALISVSDKNHIAELARGLHQLKIEILSTGSTAHKIRATGVPVTDVSTYTNFPEIMDGRVKTLHPKIHGGILSRREQDRDVMRQYDIAAIDLVVVNLYPFSETIAEENCSLADAIENIDIGGPTLIRAAAKNFTFVAVVVNTDDYQPLLQSLQQHGGTNRQLRFELAKKAFAHTARYDAAITNYLTAIDLQNKQELFPETFNWQGNKIQALRYGENSHQSAAFYRDLNTSSYACIAQAKQHQGKELSYNNIVDSDAALECVKLFSAPACVIVKHANPCGVAIATDLLSAYKRAFATDPTSAYGGIIAFNQELDAHTLQTIIHQQFVEVIIAPEVSAEALRIINQKPNIRLLTVGSFGDEPRSLDFKRVNGGLLVQERDRITVDPSLFKCVTKHKPSQQQLADLAFAWKVAAMVKSNAIVYAKEQATIGIGAGQMSRVDSAKIGISKAEEAHLPIKGSVMASDAFFPFRDSVDFAAQAGVAAIIQPGGSVRDEEVIQAANEAGMVMLFTGERHFRH